MSNSIFRAWDVFLLRAPVAIGGRGLPTADGHLAILRAAAADRSLHSAITLASPSLGRQIDRVGRGEHAGLKATQLRRAALATLRYDIRRRTRPTPFGVLSGVVGGRFDASVKFDLGGSHRTRTHVDMHWLLGVVNELETITELLPHLRVRTHPAVMHRGDRVVLDCPSPLGEPLDGETRAVVSVRNSPVVDEVLRAAVGTASVAELTASIAARFGAAPQRAGALIRALVEQEFLITDLRPPLDGSDPLCHVIGVLAAVAAPIDTVETALRALREIDDHRRSSDRLPLDASASRLIETAALAQRLHRYETPLHIDTAVDLKVTLPYEVRAEIERATELMWRMSAPKLGLSTLRDYHERFLERYGTDRLVGIRELLDPARGLGPPGGYNWPTGEQEAPERLIDRGAARNRLLHNLIGDALREGAREIELTDTVIARLSTAEASRSDVPNSCEITVHVLAPSPDALSCGDFRLVLAPSPGSHQAGATLARFGDLLAPGIRAVVDAESAALPVHIRDAERVDLSFLPRSAKAANLAHVTAHTGVRIAVGLPAATGLDEIPLADVAIGATTERLCAVHLPSGRELVPTLNNMISPMTQAPNVSRLLWEIGLEGQRLWEPWNWSGLSELPFVPRIRYGRFVFSPAVWRVDALLGVPETEFAASVRRWRQQWGVPERILVVQMDQRLLFDLTDPAHLELLWDELRKDPGIVAHEVPGDEFADGIDGCAMEMVVPLSRRDPAPTRSPHGGYTETERTSAGLGSEWMYLSLYLPSSQHADFIRSHLPELVEQARDAGCDRWFFIRYTDPSGSHLRLRLHSPDGELWNSARAIGSALDSRQRAGLIRTHRIDPYEAETERYGGARAMVAAEHVFEADSRAAIQFLELAADPACPYSLDTFAAVSVAALAHAFGLPDRHVAGPEPMTAQSDRWEGDSAAAWLSLTGERHDLPDGYRVDAQRWRAIIDPYGGWPVLRTDAHGASVLAALRSRDTAVRALRDVLGDSRTRQNRLVGSLMHMTCNRLFGGDSERERAAVAFARGAVQDNLNKRKHSK